MIKMFLTLWFSLSSAVAIAAPEKSIAEHMAKKLDELSSPQKWEDFVSKNGKLFPKLTKEAEKSFVIVQKEELDVQGSSYTLGVGYRQIFIKAPILRVKQILNSPELFKDLYGLDADANTDGISQPEKREELTSFKARIYKKVPLVPNQDYILAYHNEAVGPLWIQRAKLDVDNEHFALRDNLKVLVATKEGTIFREISMIYALKWYVRFFGPGVRDVMTKELGKISNAVKCLAENGKEVNSANAAECWKVASK